MSCCQRVLINEDERSDDKVDMTKRVETVIELQPCACEPDSEHNNCCRALTLPSDRLCGVACRGRLGCATTSEFLGATRRRDGTKRKCLVLFSRHVGLL
jgi:hypothetical protein